MSLSKNNDTNNFYPVSIHEVDWNCQYLWSTHEGNFNGAGCKHRCPYCSRQKYNNRFKIPQGLHLLKGEWEKMPLGHVLKRNFFGDKGIFIDPYTDIMTFHEKDIKQIIGFCKDSHSLHQTQFIFQTKDPAKYFNYLDMIPDGSWLGTTIASNYNRLEFEPNAPLVHERARAMGKLRKTNHKLFITIEPVMSFYLPDLSNWIEDIRPDLVFIGANTSKVVLPEPTGDEVRALIADIRSMGITVYEKSNLRRLTDV